MAQAQLYDGRASMFSVVARATQHRFRFHMTDVDGLRSDLFGRVALVEQRTNGYDGDAGSATLAAVRALADRIGFGFCVDRRIRPDDDDTQQGLWLAYDRDSRRPIAVFATLGNSWAPDALRRGEIVLSPAVFRRVGAACQAVGIPAVAIRVDEHGRPLREAGEWLASIDRMRCV